jgi:hypothetical protein
MVVGPPPLKVMDGCGPEAPDHYEQPPARKARRKQHARALIISSWKAQMQESQFVFENIADVLNRLFDSKIGGRGRRRCLRGQID